MPDTPDDRGSALLLLPAAMVVVLVMGAITIDVTVRHLATHQAVDAARGAANDAVTAGLDVEAMRAGHGYRVDPMRARTAAARAVAARSLRHRVARVEVTSGPTPDAVTVEVVLVVDPVLAGALPGGGPIEVSGRSTASAQQR